ncbi:PPOX class F420-dependent oxidoreductase [Natronobacterium gregoryi]|uniref:F420-dependent enzyme n=2 Tax=Natronobacterium gregoryi TaxID=44930 RepID=L0AE93_NATGS|nr:PPOX class F420-dependent oxidoreductase [Natronobacterium gregoryi]AFZ72223.1 PPOX class probable F420-dependent enzyme [Natronobacterium gregoryi SP2]ELY62378.1 F420-dependent enzyme [Natronobacterium gregoryi SP2]PLK20170.1 PPOX class F420-dependent oxidoreductase [Natronobacterium gregoryi SP2]SFJ28412.1 PPOX class probable F420-dependent enzyme [Natronobacterium gregoryi]
MASIPDDFQDLFEKKTFAHVSTLLPDGSPHVTPVWVDYDADADRILVNTERDRRKEKNVRNDPRVGVSMTDPDDPYRLLSVTGEVDEITTENAREHIDELTQRYMGEEEYPSPIETERVIISIEPDQVRAMGG